MSLSSFFSAEAQDVQKEKWWKESVFYQIYMPSFADSNGDGFGDFKGIESKLDYLQKLGIKGIWLTPFLKSPKVDNGYDVADYYQFDPTYGTKADFDNFLKKAHSKGIKVIMDMVLNHTSTDCNCFKRQKNQTIMPFVTSIFGQIIPIIGNLFLEVQLGKKMKIQINITITSLTAEWQI